MNKAYKRQILTKECSLKELDRLIYQTKSPLLKKYREYADITTLKTRVEASDKGYIENIFRIKQPDGNYRWKEMSIMMVPGSGGNKLLKRAGEVMLEVTKGKCAVAKCIGSDFAMVTDITENR